MKKVMFALIISLLLTSLLTSASAATYQFEKGKDLNWFQTKTGNSFEQLVKMNPGLTKDYSPKQGDKLTYLGKIDFDLTILWCQGRINDPKLDAKNSQFFKFTIKDLEIKKVRWDITEPEGTYYELIIAFSEAWQERYWQAEELLGDEEYGIRYTAKTDPGQGFVVFVYVPERLPRGSAVG